MLNSHRRRLFWMLLLVLGVTGCGSQQFSPSSRELMKPLQTSVFSKKPEWIDATEKKIVAQYDADNISKDERDALMGIIEMTRSGDWTGAQRRLTSIIDSQRATAYDVSRLQEGAKNAAVAEHRKQARQARR